MKRINGFLIFLVTLLFGGCPQARAEGDGNCMNECNQENGRCLKACDKRCK